MSTSLAWGQDAPVLEEVIVTAQKRVASLQDTPISVAVLGAEAVEKLRVSNLLDIAHAVPNVDIRQTTNGSSGARIYIRGVGVNDHVVTLDGAVGVYMDGVYMARNTGLAFDVTDLERIEVLRGPQGSLWGRNTTGGAINLIAKKPTGEFGFKQSIDVGNYDYLRANTQIDFPELAGVSAKLSLLHEEKDGWVSNRGPGVDFAEKDTQGARLALRWQAADSLLIDYAYDYAQSEFGSAYYQNGAPFNPGFEAVPFSYDRVDSTAASTTYRASEYEVSGHSLTIAWDINERLTLKSITGYRELEQRNYTDNGANPVSPRLFSNDPFNVDQEQFSQEFQLLGSALNDTLRYTLGLYYFEEDGREFNSDYITLALPPTFLELKIYDRDLEAENSAQAVFGEVTWTPDVLDQRLHLTAGVRYSRDERDIDIVHTAFAGIADDDWSNTSPSFIVSYDLSDTSNVYAKYIEGYRTGGFNGRASSEREATTPVDEETLVSTELGLKSEWFDRRLRVNAALFHSDYDDIQLSLFDRDGPPGAVLRINAGEAKMKGVEVDVMAALTQGLTLRASYAYLDSDFVEVIDPLTGSDISDDFLLVASPENSFTVDLEYRFGRLAWGELSADINYAWKDEREIGSTVQDDADPLESFGIWNARLKLSAIELGSAGALAVSLWGRNVTDEEYQLDGFKIPTTGSTLITYGEPRSYGVRLDYQY
jgi:iron complex outermembrane receptor protein